jgi:uncharacterized protein with beta-barrel porin domain
MRMIVCTSNGAPRRAGLLTSTAFMAVILASEAAQAACTPSAPDAAANSVTAICTGLTDGQGDNAVGSTGDPFGYGHPLVNNLALEVTQGATVRGSDVGLSFNNGTVINAGVIEGTNITGIYADQSATVTNYGTIFGAHTGFVAFKTGIVNNYGSIEGADEGVTATTVILNNSGSIKGNLAVVGADVTIANSGMIEGNDYAVWGNADANVTNSAAGTIVGTTFGVAANNILTLTNFGLIRSTVASAVSGTEVTVTNAGTIMGSHGISSSNFVRVTNTRSGVIEGSSRGINASASASVTNDGIIKGVAGIVAPMVEVSNTGTIEGSNLGISAILADVRNTGVIKGVTGIDIANTGTVTNAGTIIGSGGTAVQFSGALAADTLSVLPGARFGGLVDFGGGADTVNFGPGSWVLNTAQFDAALSTINTSGNPYAVTANQIIVADLSGFGAMNRAVMDITGWIASVLPEAPVFDPAQGGAANAFAAIESAAPRFDDAFASFPSALPYAPTPVFRGGTVSDASGNRYWAQAFGGRREQDTDNNFIGSITQGFGGAVGFDGPVSANTRLGVLFGGSTNETNLEFNAGETDTDTLFGGVYSRTLFGASFLDLAVIGGKLENDSKRNIGGGLAMETASASYDGWFVSPMLTLGHRFALPYNLTLTPALKARYVAAHFDGYAESGSSANLTVADRNFQAFEERAEVTLASVQHFGDSRIVMRGTLGALAQQRTGDSTVNIALVGQNFIAATPDEDNVFGLYGGAGFDWQTGNVALFASGEVTGTSDNTIAFAGKGGVRVVW